VIVPIGSEFYYASRPTLAVARPDGGNPNAALALDANWGLHPALRDTLHPLWAKREMAFVPFAGTSDDLTRSHFETQDTIELGQAVGGSRDYRSGFMSRLATELTRVKPISFTDQLPLIFRGQTQIPNIGIASVGCGWVRVEVFRFGIPSLGRILSRHHQFLRPTTSWDVIARPPRQVLAPPLGIERPRGPQCA